jgi:L-serine/L-threonine ammonia-lyase
MNAPPLHISTPLLQSPPLSALAGHPVWLKMDALQPSGSFKIRGVGLMCQRAFDRGEKHFISSSGGNAGLAVAYAGRKLGAQVTVIVPETTPQFMRQKIEAEGARVRVEGTVWDEADSVARELSKAPGCSYAPPFDHPDIWEGHGTIIEEVAKEGQKPGSVVVAVGGGGLLCGVLAGLHRVGWQDVPVLAVETKGAASFAATFAARSLVTIEKIESVAKSLGARRVCAEALRWVDKHTIKSILVEDRQAVDACLKFADDHRVLVEPACGAALAVSYDHPESLIGPSSLLIVCGGSAVSRAQLALWDRQI